MLEALCRQSSTTLDIVHAEDGPPITQRTSGLDDETIEIIGVTGTSAGAMNGAVLVDGLVRGGSTAARSTRWCFAIAAGMPRHGAGAAA